MRPGLSRYATIAEQLKQKILQGAWLPGGAIPSETELASMFGVALGTVRKALDVLVEQNVVERVHGKGTFVTGPLSGSSMFRFFRFDNATPSSRILSFVCTHASPQIAQALQLHTSDLVYEIQRVRALAATLLLETIHVDATRFAGLLSVDWNDSQLLYSLYQQACGQVVHRVVDTISFGWLNAQDALHLQLQEGAAAVIVRRVAYALNGDVLEVRLTKGDALQFNYSVNIS